MDQNFFHWFAGWLPAIILPLSTGLQLWKIFKEKSGRGVSTLSWVLFGIAILGAYIFVEKYWDIRAILSFLLTAILDYLIVLLVFWYGKSSKE